MRTFEANQFLHFLSAIFKRGFDGCGHGFGGCDGLGGLGGFKGLSGFSGFGGFSRFGGFVF